MRSSFDGPGRPANPILAAAYGAIVAIILAYGCSYFLTHIGVGMITMPGKAEHGPAVLSRAGINLYAMQHISLVGLGSGAAADRISAIVSFPITFLVLVPFVALMIGGYAAGKLTAGYRRWGVAATAVLVGLFYAAILTAFSGIVDATADSSVLPIVKGWEFNPHGIVFGPSGTSTIVTAAILGIIFAYIGSLAAIRGLDDEAPGKWWVCGKAVVAAVLTVQLVIAGAVAWWFFTGRSSDEVQEPGGGRFVQMLPTAAGIAYALANGSTLSSGVESFSADLGLLSRPFKADVNVYRGITMDDDREKSHKPLSPYKYILTALACVAALVSGWLAVAWGARDGSVPTAARVAVVHSAYLVLIVWLCRLGWQFAQGAIRTAIVIAPHYDPLMLLSPVGVFIFAFVGAYAAGRKHSTRLGPTLA